MASIRQIAAAVATILVREGVDYAQSKAVFKAARERAGLRAAPERRGSVDRLTVEEELRFLDRAYAQDGRTGLMLQTLQPAPEPPSLCSFVSRMSASSSA
jgi:integrase/recombinase XerD